jgi:drug/metabolite transporter (DMT)-like permease
MPSTGSLICLASAAAFGAMGIFGKLAYAEGAGVGTLLSLRFAAAALLFWLLAASAGQLGRLRSVARRDVGLALALGAAGYSAQAGCYFAALDRLDASLLSLVVYIFPALVTVAAIALRRERASGRRLAALVLVSTGLVLVLAGAATGALDPLGTALGFTAAVVYAIYILSSEGVASRLGPLLLSSLVCTGAALTLTLGAAAAGDLRPEDLSVAGFGWLAGLTLVSTVAAVALFFAGLARVGPTTASILSTAEPLTAVVLAFVVFGEALSSVQLAGAAFVLGGVLVLTRRNTDDRTIERKGRARGGRDQRSRACHRGGAGPRRRHGLRDRPQHALVALGVRPARDDRGDR